MDGKPLMFISTPNTISSTRKNQSNFDSRVGVIDEKIKLKLQNVVKLNNKGRNINCKIFLEKDTFTFIPKELDNEKLVYNNMRIHLSRIKEVEILQL